MSNRLFENDGFWERVDEAIESSGMTKIQIAEKMGVERKSLYPRRDANGDNRSWHSGRLASFCKITGVSADWLLGLSRTKEIKYPKSDTIQFKVVNKQTGKEPILDHNHLFKEKWFKRSRLIWCDIEGWVVSEDGVLMLADECGNVAYAPDKYEVVLL